MIKNLKKWWEKLVGKSCFSSTTQKAQNHSNQRTILSFFMPPAGLEPALCRQKGILSPSCLPAFGKVVFCSLYRFISHCERDFSFASERDSHFFDKIILPPFSLHVNHVKLFHLVVLDLRSVRDPGLPPGAFALPRCAPLLFFCWNFTGCNFGLWNKKQVYYCSI